MTDKTIKRERPKRNRWLLISAIVIFLVVISALAVNSYMNQTKVVVRDSSTYFAISDLAGLYQTISSKFNATDPGGSVFITQFAFNFTPVGGDAYDTRIFAEGMQNPTQTWWAGLIANGTSTYSTEIQLSSPILLQQQEDGTFPLSIRMQANNANGQIDVNGTITLTFNATKLGGNFIYAGPHPTA